MARKHFHVLRDSRSSVHGEIEDPIPKSSEKMEVIFFICNILSMLRMMFEGYCLWNDCWWLEISFL